MGTTLTVVTLLLVLCAGLGVGLYFILRSAGGSAAAHDHVASTLPAWPPQQPTPSAVTTDAAAGGGNPAAPARSNCSALANGSNVARLTLVGDGTGSAWDGARGLRFPQTGAPTRPAASVTVPSAGGANYDGKPSDGASPPLTWYSNQLCATLTSDARQRVLADPNYDPLGLHLFVRRREPFSSDPVGIQARVSYDFDGDGYFDFKRVFEYLPLRHDATTHPWQEYAANGAVTKTVERAASGAGSVGLVDLTHGTVRLEVWAAIGTVAAEIHVDAPNSHDAQSALTGFNMGWENVSCCSLVTER